MESLNLSFTQVTDIGLQKLSGLTMLKPLNLDIQVTGSGVYSLTSLTGLTHLDFFEAHISDYGTSCLRYSKKLQSLELRGGSITDARVKNIKDLTSMTSLNLSQNF